MRAIHLEKSYGGKIGSTERYLSTKKYQINGTKYQNSGTSSTNLIYFLIKSLRSAVIINLKKKVHGYFICNIYFIHHITNFDCYNKLFFP